MTHLRLAFARLAATGVPDRPLTEKIQDANLMSSRGGGGRMSDTGKGGDEKTEGTNGQADYGAESERQMCSYRMGTHEREFLETSLTRESY
jgi:hypothetical protein